MNWKAHKAVTGSHWLVMANEKSPYEGDGPTDEIAVTWNKDAENIANLIAAAPDLLEALEGLQRELYQHIRMDVKKHFSLMVYDAAATKAIAKAKGE